jgi:CheY-like chemotaxis protein
MVDRKKVLLVDDNPTEREELSRHLAQAGYQLDHANDGAPAINKAISGLPDAIVTVADMPMVDGFKLCQLLRTNPATRHIPFIFITDKETNPNKLGEFIMPADDFILRPFKTEEFLGRVNNLFYRVDKVQEVSSEDDRSVAGTLTEIALVDLLQIFKMNRKSGILTLKMDMMEGSIYIRDGAVINARTEKVTGEKAIIRLVGWHNGTFEFKPGHTPTETKIHQSTENLIMEGLRQFDELNRLKGELLPRETPLLLRKKFKGPDSKLRPVTREVLHLLEYFSLVGDILDNSTYPDLEIHRTIQALLEQEIIGVKSEDGSVPHPSVEQLLSLEEALKIGYYLGVGTEEPGQYWKGKIYLFARRPELVTSLLERSGTIPEFRRENQEMEEGGESSIAPGIIASLGIMEKTTLLLINLPPGRGYEPLWRAFQKGTIGALLIGTGEKEDDHFFTTASEFLWEEKIPFTAVSFLQADQADDTIRNPDGKLRWLPEKVSDPDFPRRVFRHIFEAILAS